MGRPTNTSYPGARSCPKIKAYPVRLQEIQKKQKQTGRRRSIKGSWHLIDRITLYQTGSTINHRYLQIVSSVDKLALPAQENSRSSLVFSIASALEDNLLLRDATRKSLSPPTWSFCASSVSTSTSTSASPQLGNHLRSKEPIVNRVALLPGV